jgi:hypothetical protein
MAFIARDHRRHEFAKWSTLENLEPLRIAAPDVPYYIAKVRERLPHAEIIPVESIRDFFRDETDRYDALLYTAESGSAWSLVYPQFSVAVPQPDPVVVPLAYPVALRDTEMVEFLSTWVELKKTDGTYEHLFAHWILGEAVKQRGKRWSVMRDVLGWVD